LKSTGSPFAATHDVVAAPPMQPPVCGVVYRCAMARLDLGTTGEKPMNGVIYLVGLVVVVLFVLSLLGLR